VYAQHAHNVITTGMLREACLFIYVCLVVCEQCCGLTRTFSNMLWGLSLTLHRTRFTHLHVCWRAMLWWVSMFMCCWEVLWLCDVGEVVVLFGGSWVVGREWKEHKRVPMTDSPKTIATTVPTYVSIIAHIGYRFQVK